MLPRKPDYTLYLVTDRNACRGRDLLELTRATVAAGCTLVQLREKECSTRDMMELGRAVHQITREAGIPLFVNDRIDVALALEAEGVHVGQSDMAALDVRRIAPGMILGVSATNVEEAVQAQADGADYIGAGDVFGTPSKPDACPPIGAEGLSAIVQAVSIPVVAIGGIKAEHIDKVKASGAAGVAVISAILSAPDPAHATQDLLKRLRA